MVCFENLKKSYGHTAALCGVDGSVSKGELFGIIGPDGAGKTTLLRILATLIMSDSGVATVDGLDVVRDCKRIRTRIGYMPGRFSLYHDLTVEENLTFFASVFGTSIRENYHLIADIYRHIEPFRNRRAGQLSGGMKQKLALSCALIHKPSALLLDEPTTGVDPVSRRELWEMLRRLKEQGITILVSTPYMDEATRCDRIALIRNGQFLKTDTPAHIAGQFGKTLWAVSGERMATLLADLRRCRGVLTCFAFGSTHHITVDAGLLTVESLRQQLIGQGHTHIEIQPVTATVEDCFMELAAGKTENPESRI
ncbi:MAG: ABC transporter ATP-binding protein [Tannerella sp.]|jgi:ABC-type multidrug transport system ATPase subunit|nr:ABC transporter ATP-binding protein [Tannerella sp.]